MGEVNGPFDYRYSDILNHFLLIISSWHQILIFVLKNAGGVAPVALLQEHEPHVQKLCPHSRSLRSESGLCLFAACHPPPRSSRVLSK